MAFDLDMIIKNKKDTKIEERKRVIHKLFAYINELDNISQQTRDALHVYLDHRLRLRGADKLSVVKLNKMITELLEMCCNKNFFEITPEDTDNNFDEIMYQLKFAVEHKFRFQIYHDDTMGLDYIKSKLEVKKPHFNSKLSKSDIEKFFEGWWSDEE